MKKICICVVITLIVICNVMGNNIQVTNTTLVSQNTTDDFVLVQFDVSWENSWRVVGGTNNWDAAWLFIKYRIGAGPWTHAYLNNMGHESCEGMLIDNGLLTPGTAFDPITNPSLGVFLYRDEPGMGNINCQQVRLRWNYGANGLADNTQVDIKVFAIEQVYISAGSFKVGTGGGEFGPFFTYPNNSTPFHITNENAIPVGQVPGHLYYNDFSGFQGDGQGPIPAEYPKGTLAFYAMKYEISQQSYIEFLNTLTRPQQQACIRTNIGGTTITNRFVLTNTSSPSYRNGISCKGTIPPSPAPVDFFSDVNNNAIFNETADGQCIACNWLLWSDVSAYLDWSALRPMTELEFEKCGRGPLNPVPNEYAWGNNTIHSLTGIVNSGEPNESPGTYYFNITGQEYFNPTRCGFYARTSNDRTVSGAGYFGCLDLVGNVLERTVTVGNPQGRSFTGLHGNGMLTAAGAADVAQWPVNSSGLGVGCRGGSFETGFYYLSDRGTAGFNFSQYTATGGRGVRTAPQ